MYGDEFRKIKDAVDDYQRLGQFAEELQRRRQALDVHRKQGERIKIAIIGNSGSIDLPEQLQVRLYGWLEAEFTKLQCECSRLQQALTCPAGTSNR